MKIFSKVILLLFSLLIISENQCGCISDKNINFHYFEEKVLENSSFVENGIKLEYTLDDKLNNESNRIYNLLLKNKELSVKRDNDLIYADNLSLEYNIKLYLQDNLIKVEIVLINRDSKINTKMLKKIIDELKNNNFIEERYFLLVKGKIKSEEKLDKSMLINEDINNTYKININNGVVYKSKFKNDEIINTTIVTYDTGAYVIIGTPVIFLTY